MELKFRKLNADEIDVRVAKVKKTNKSSGVSLLLYKDARIDQNLLDETVGQYNWQRDHKELKGVIYCGIGIYNKDASQWVWKWDAGSESFSDKEKGEASDSFKRAGFNWGIGRELYTAPFIWVTEVEIKDSGRKDNRGETIWTTYDTFIVKEISYDLSGNINDLVIVNKKTRKVVFSTKEKNVTKESSNENYATTEQIAELETLVADLDVVAKYFKKDNINQLTKVEIQNIIDRKKKAN